MLFRNDKDMTEQIKIASTWREKHKNVSLEHDAKIGRCVKTNYSHQRVFYAVAPPIFPEHVFR